MLAVIVVFINVLILLSIIILYNWLFIIIY